MSRRPGPRSLAATLLLVLLIPFAPVPGAHADDPSADDAAHTWAVVPASATGPDGRGRLDYTLEPGTRQQDQVAVRNLGDEPLTLTLYAQDAEQTTDGAFEVLTPDDDAKRVGAWVRLDTSAVTVPGRSSVVVPFVLDVPVDAEPGDWAGGILAAGETVDRTEGPAVTYAAGTRVYLRVAGTVQPALDVDGLTARYDGPFAPLTGGSLDVDAALHNTGNVRLAPDTVVRVRALFGLWSTTAPLDAVEEILPGGGTSTAARVAGVPPLGPLWLTVELSGATSRDQDLTGAVVLTSAPAVVWAVPWVPLAAMLLLAAGLVLVARQRRRRRRAPAPRLVNHGTDLHEDRRQPAR